MSGDVVLGSPSQVAQAFLQRLGFEEAEETVSSSTQLRLIMRPKDATLAKIWSVDGGVMQTLLRAQPRSTWTVDISRKYFERGNSLVWLWRVIFQAPAIANHYQEIASLIVSVGAPAQQDVLVTPLLLASPNRNASTGFGSKGAVPTNYGSR
jgi:hypothetical protein